MGCLFAAQLQSCLSLRVSFCGNLFDVNRNKATIKKVEPNEAQLVKCGSRVQDRITFQPLEGSSSYSVLPCLAPNLSTRARIKFPTSEHQ